jgi:hypothetical protein
MITSKLVDLSDLDHEKLRALVETNSEPLRLVRLGLTRGSAVPTDAAIANFGTISRDLISLKTLAKLLSAEGHLRELEDQPGEAAQSYTDAIHLGSAMSHGGFMMNRLVGIACEGVGSIPLVKLVPKLNCDQIRPLIPGLEQIATNGVAWDEVLRNENRFVRAQMGKYPNPIKLLWDLWQSRTVRRASKERHEVAAAHLRLLTTELALRCFRTEQGQAPRTLDQLVLKFLTRVPLDPFSDHPLIYRPQGTNWLLYSVGPDRVDDGGKPIGNIISGDYGIGLPGYKAGPAKNGDLFYNSPW